MFKESLFKARMFNFAAIHVNLLAIRSMLGDGYLVSFGLKDEYLCVNVAKPYTGLDMFCMTFNDENDFELDGEKLVLEFVQRARNYFEGTP